MPRSQSVCGRGPEFLVRSPSRHGRECRRALPWAGEGTGTKTSENAATLASRLGVFKGSTAVKDFLNPDNHPPIPLVELPDRLNPFRAQNVRIFGKLMYLLPLLSIKSLTAINMLLEADAAGDLAGADGIIENSSGNTAFALGILAELYGIRRVVAVVPWDIAPGKLDLLRLCGVEPRLVRGVAGEPSGIAQARDGGRKPGWFNPAQYENEANPRASEKWVAPQIWKQTDGKLTVFAAGLGTTGTLVGAKRYFRRIAPRVTLVGAMCGPNSAVPGVRSEARLREVAFPWRETADYVVEVETKESFKKSLELCRAGLMGGPSSGFALMGLLKLLQAREASSGLDPLRNEDGEVVAAFICADTPLPYLDKYSTHLDPDDF
ncbi:MAG: pyridoxal-phosphate dependent enzyme [Thermoanaerobaculia bacterium]